MNLTNQFLIALPDMQDLRFSKSVILICEHNASGAMGLVINQTASIDSNHVFSDLNLKPPIDNKKAFKGGPMNKNNGFVLHQSNDVFQSTIRIQDNLNLSTSKDILKAISNQNFNHEWKFILGFSSWHENQLEDEIAQNTWLTCPMNLNLIFNTEPENMWHQALALIGISNYQNISGAAHA